MSNIMLPETVREVILAPDNDQAGLEAIEKTRAALKGQFKVQRLLPTKGQDWVDVLGDHEGRSAIIEYEGEQDRETAETESWVERFCNGY